MNIISDSFNSSKRTSIMEINGMTFTRIEGEIIKWFDNQNQEIINIQPLERKLFEYRTINKLTESDILE